MFKVSKLEFSKLQFIEQLKVLGLFDGSPDGRELCNYLKGVVHQLPAEDQTHVMPDGQYTDTLNAIDEKAKPGVTTWKAMEKLRNKTNPWYQELGLHTDEEKKDHYNNTYNKLRTKGLNSIVDTWNNYKIIAVESAYGVKDNRFLVVKNTKGVQLVLCPKSKIVEIYLEALIHKGPELIQKYLDTLPPNATVGATGGVKVLQAIESEVFNVIRGEGTLGIFLTKGYLQHFHLKPPPKEVNTPATPAPVPAGFGGAFATPGQPPSTPGFGTPAAAPVAATPGFGTPAQPPSAPGFGSPAPSNVATTPAFGSPQSSLQASYKTPKQERDTSVDYIGSLTKSLVLDAEARNTDAEARNTDAEARKTMAEAQKAAAEASKTAAEASLKAEENRQQLLVLFSPNRKTRTDPGSNNGSPVPPVGVGRPKSLFAGTLDTNPFGQPSGQPSGQTSTGGGQAAAAAPTVQAAGGGQAAAAAPTVSTVDGDSDDSSTAQMMN